MAMWNLFDVFAVFCVSREALYIFLWQKQASGKFWLFLLSVCESSVMSESSATTVALAVGRCEAHTFWGRRPAGPASGGRSLRRIEDFDACLFCNGRKSLPK